MRNKGITLVALVVTIIVLLILAGITINMVLKDNGIIERTKEAAEVYKKAEQNDVNALKELAEHIKNKTRNDDDDYDEETVRKEVEDELTTVGISPTGVSGQEPQISNPDQIENPNIHIETTQNTVNSVINQQINAGFIGNNLYRGLLNSYLMKYSSRVIYEFTPNSIKDSPWYTLLYKPEIIEDDISVVDGEEELNTILEDNRGWLTIFNSPINYPIMQGAENLYYAFHNLYGDSSITGAIYMDARNSPDFSDRYNMIYGHNISNGTMLGSLNDYRNRTYYNEHKNGIIVGKNDVYDLSAFAVAETNSNETHVYGVGDRIKRLKNFLKSDTENSDKITFLQYDEEEAQSAQRILALSTCMNNYNGTKDRLVVFFKMTTRSVISLNVEGYEGEYDGNEYSINVDVMPYDVSIEYSVDGGKTWTDEQPSLTERGTLDIIVRATRGEVQEQKSAQIKIN